MKNVSGKIGEDYTANKLIEDGYGILAKNYRTRFGEIDIVAEMDGIIAFVEVKTRKTGSLYEPAEAVTYQKRQRIILAAQEYLQKNEVKMHSYLYYMFTSG